VLTQCRCSAAAQRATHRGRGGQHALLPRTHPPSHPPRAPASVLCSTPSSMECSRARADDSGPPSSSSSSSLSSSSSSPSLLLLPPPLLLLPACRLAGVEGCVGLMCLGRRGGDHGKGSWGSWKGMTEELGSQARWWGGECSVNELGLIFDREGWLGCNLP